MFDNPPKKKKMHLEQHEKFMTEFKFFGQPVLFDLCFPVG